MTGGYIFEQKTQSLFKNGFFKKENLEPNGSQ